MLDSYQNIEKLGFPDNIRKRPGMYMGDTTDGSALHHMLNEVLDNSVDEFLQGHCKYIKVTLLNDNRVSVADDGRGIPVNYNEKEKKYNIELAVEDLHAGGKFNQENYKRSGGLHGVGLKAVNALSSKFEVNVQRNGKYYSIIYSKGKQIKRLTEEDIEGEPKIDGTRIIFTPDTEIFKNITTFNPDTIVQRLKQTAFLNSGLRIEFLNEITKSTIEFYYENGLEAFIEEIDKNQKIANVITAVAKNDTVDLKLALKWNTTAKENFQCFTNNTYQRDGGTHLTAIRFCLTKVLLPYFKDEKIEVISDDIREGLTYIISIYIDEPSFNSQTKDKLTTSDIRPALDELIKSNLQNYFDKNQTQLKLIKEKILVTAKAREAAKKAKEDVVKKSNIILTGNFKACSETNPALAELIIVEGDSAGGTAKQARDRKFQAVLPLRGKILNVEKASGEKIQASKEINILKQVIGTFPDYNYHKVIIATDADVDGSHIRTLLLTLFYRQMPELIQQGFVYIGKPPLFRVTYRNKNYYFQSEVEVEEFKRGKGKVTISRFKGLGEMNPPELWETTLNPKTRKLGRITLTNIFEAEDSFNTLMSKEVEPRKNFIINSENWKI